MHQNQIQHKALCAHPAWCFIEIQHISLKTKQRETWYSHELQDTHKTINLPEEK